MLQKMRENFTGGFAIAILAVIGLSFVFFGLNYSFIGSTFAAKVDGEEIDANTFERNYRDALQRNPQLASLTGELRVQVRRNLLDQLIADQLIANYLNDNGFRVSDEQVMRSVQQTPEFQLDGKFDMETYRAYLATRGMEPLRFEELQRNSLRRQQLQLAVTATALITPAEYRRYLNLFSEQRVITVATILEAAVADDVLVDAEMIAAYYDDNQMLYQLPETVDVEYLEIRRDAVAEGVDVDEQELLAYYEDSKGRYLQDEQRQARHILLPINDDEAAAEANANTVLTRLEAGESFADLAAEVSADGGTASDGGNLGTLTRSQYPGELGSAIFSMNEGQTDGPIKSDFGFHIIRLDKIHERGPLPLEQVRGELLSELRENEAADRYRALERTLSDALFDNADLQTISTTTGLEILSASGITRSGGEPFGTNQASIDAIFSEPVLTDGQLSEVIELDANRSAVFRVVKHEEATRQPLADVEEQVEAELRSQQAETILAGRAEQMLAAIAAGDDFGEAAEAAGLIVAEPQLLSRQDQSVDQALLFEVFAAGKPSLEKPVTGRVRNSSGGYSVYSLDAVLPGRPESIPQEERDSGKLMLAQQSGIGDFQAFVRALYDDADIVVNDDVLAANDLLQ